MIFFSFPNLTLSESHIFGGLTWIDTGNHNLRGSVESQNVVPPCSEGEANIPSGDTSHDNATHNGNSHNKASHNLAMQSLLAAKKKSTYLAATLLAESMLAMLAPLAISTYLAVAQPQHSSHEATHVARHQHSDL